jgi:hypothetical protein
VSEQLDQLPRTLHTSNLTGMIKPGEMENAEAGLTNNEMVLGGAKTKKVWWLWKLKDMFKRYYVPKAANREGIYR